MGLLKCLLVLLLLYTCRSNNSPITDSAIIINDSLPKIDNDQKVKLQVESIKNILSEGDIIFRGGIDVESNIIREFSGTNKMFSHCGIILKYGGELLVTHILGGTTNPSGTILHQPINDFLSFPENESAGVYSLDISKNELAKVYAFIAAAEKAGITFDLHFDLFSKQRLYCTEFIIDALCQVKKYKGKFAATTYQLKNTKYFFLHNKKEDFVFYPIDKFQESKYLKKKGVFIFPNFQQ